MLDGIAGITIMAAPPLISSLWFPPDERTTATAINQVNEAGVLVRKLVS
jgi:FLVCR family MFS transporter